MCAKILTVKRKETSQTGKVIIMTKLAETTRDALIDKMLEEMEKENKPLPQSHTADELESGHAKA